MTPHPTEGLYQQPIVVYFKRGCDLYTPRQSLTSRDEQSAENPYWKR